MPRVDLHLHTHHSHDSVAPAKSIVERCLKASLDCIAVTDHNTIAGALEVRELAPFPVIVGEEIRSTGGDIIGLFLESSVPRDLSPQDTARAIKDQGGLVLVPHPFDRFRPSSITGEALTEVLPLVDIIETFNAHNYLRRHNERAASYAERHNLLPAAVSDAHSPLELGKTYMELPDMDVTAGGLMASLAGATLVCRRANPVLRLTTAFVKLRRLLRG